MKKLILTLAAVLALSLALTACGGGTGSMGIEDNDETRGLDVTLDRAGAGSGTINYITIGEGECLVVSPMLEKGGLDMVVTQMVREATADDMGIADEPSVKTSIEGKVMTYYELEPGEYAIGLTTTGNPTGTVKLFPYSYEEIQAQDEALEEALGEIGVTLTPEE